MNDITPKLLERLRVHLRLVRDDQEVDLSHDLHDLGLDSMTAVDLLMDLEKTFEITFPDNAIAKETFRTGATLRDKVQDLMQG